MVRWPSEAVDRQPVRTASEGHRTKPQISTGCGISSPPAAAKRAASSAEGTASSSRPALFRRATPRWGKEPAVHLDGATLARIQSVPHTNPKRKRGSATGALACASG